MKIIFTVLISVIAFSLTTAQEYQPLQITGFNHDVIAEGNGKNALSTTTTALDAINPSNFVLCSKSFAESVGMPSGYGLPDNGTITTPSATYQLAPYNTKNALYLTTGRSGTLTFLKPEKKSLISIMGFATEGGVLADISVYYTDGTSLHLRERIYPDWFTPTEEFEVVTGFGRVKREEHITDNPMYYEGYPSNPRLFFVPVYVDDQKSISRITVLNDLLREPLDNRLVILAVSGAMIPREKQITKHPVTGTLENFSIHGKVVNAKTKALIPNAFINFYCMRKGMTAFSNGQGLYERVLLTNYDYEVNVSHEGYYPLKTNLNITETNGDVIERDFELIPIEKEVLITSVNIHGQVTDAKTNQPIPATLSVTDGVSGQTKQLTTNEQPYTITLPLQTKFVIKAHAKGYVDKVDSVDTKSDKDNIELNFKLQPIEVGMVVNLKKVLFRQGTAELLNDSYAELDEVFQFLRENPPVRIELAGHTDNQGSAKANQKLSQSRVDAVKKYLTSKGIQPNRISGKGYGGTKPIASNATEETRKLNRRVEFTITGN